jgi:hypothetical protein
VIGHALAQAKWYKCNTNTNNLQLGGEKKWLIYYVLYCGCKFQYRTLRQLYNRRERFE